MMRDDKGLDADQKRFRGTIRARGEGGEIVKTFGDSTLSVGFWDRLGSRGAHTGQEGDL